MNDKGERAMTNEKQKDHSEPSKAPPSKAPPVDTDMVVHPPAPNPIPDPVPDPPHDPNE